MFFALALLAALDGNRRPDLNDIRVITHLASMIYLTFHQIESTNSPMGITYDAHKSARNDRDRGLPFSLAAWFDFSTALFQVDDRFNDGETHIRAQGMIGNRLHVLVFTETGQGIRVISLRKANQREINHYEQATHP